MKFLATILLALLLTSIVKITYADDTSLSARIDVVRELKNQSIKELETSINSIKKIVDDYTA